MSDRIAKLMENPKKGLITLAWPVIISMFFSTMLNFVDFFFVGGLGPNALAAVQISFPIFFIIISISSGVSIGTTALIAKRLGEKNKMWAEETAMHSLLLSGGLAVFFTLLAFFALPIAGSLGGGAEVSGMAADYLGAIFAGSIIFFIVASMNAILQAEGDTKTPMKLAIVFTLSNIILDPIFIYTLKMGVGGAAIATVLSEGIALLIYIRIVLLRKKNYLQIDFKKFIYTPQIIKNILKVGVPSALLQLTFSIAVIVVNLLLSGFGDKAISAFGIGFRMDSIGILPIFGFASGAIPLIGYFRGAKDYAGAKRVYHLALKMVLMYTVPAALMILALSGILPPVFTSDTSVTSMASEYLKILALSYPLIGITIITSSSFQALGKGIHSLVIVAARSLLILIPAAYYLAYHTGLGISGIWFGILMSTGFSAIVAFMWIEAVFRGLCKECAYEAKMPARQRNKKH